LADAQHLPHGRHQAGDRHLNFHDTGTTSVAAFLADLPGLQVFTAKQAVHNL